MDIILISTIYITLLFFISGLYKIKDFIQVVKEFTNKTKIPFTLSKIIIILIEYRCVKYILRYLWD